MLTRGWGGERGVRWGPPGTRTAMEGQKFSQFLLSSQGLGLSLGHNWSQTPGSISPQSWLKSVGQRRCQERATLDSSILTESVLNLCRVALQSRSLCSDKSKRRSRLALWNVVSLEVLCNRPLRTVSSGLVGSS